MSYPDRPDFHDAALADDLASILANAPLGLSLAELARRRGRREGAIRQTLRADPRFVAYGENRGRRWRLVQVSGEAGA